ncbi:AT-HOOK MOTIF NUCLEAR-LOCALIZED PROTEIN 13-LIKE ISOFORM X1 [Salix purpurea]|uniref:AT-hook motif nuclear-localized protein n=1 Tax=Salix purpurea TaxID=77065 RepID=A0A9Q0TI16_SALPP|nr:AT-HOOK MOTIF NUCLEAR-LOCALIZED PROTEIN 13-LIKE ISOFORM X1 [Salix purpurea]
MDLREPPPPTPPPQTQTPPQQLQPPHAPTPLQSQPNMILGPTSSYPTTASPHLINNLSISPQNAAVGGGFPFNAMSAQRLQSKPEGALDGSSPTSSSGMGFSIEPAKKKRGRPRKYTPEGNIALGLSPTTISAGLADSGGGPGSGVDVASEHPSKKHRGRPPGSGKKQLDALGGTGGVGFTPHVITVKEGEDIASKIMAFSQQGPRTVCILSANGAICNVTLRQPAMSGGSVTYEGRFEIISLSGSFLLSESNGSRSRTGGLSVSLAGSDGRVLGGGVAGMLTAASAVQVILGSFIADGKRSNSNASKSRPSSTPPPQMLNFGSPLTTASPPSHGGSSESLDENGGSPVNRTPGIYGNPGQLIHNMQMYQLWSGQNTQ